MEKLKDVRLYNGLTQKEVADVLGVKRSTYSGWENGIDTIPLLRLNDFCNYFNVSLDYVCGLTKIDNVNSVKNDIDKIILGKNLKEVRLTHGDTQEIVAKLLNTDRSNYSRYESGERLILTSFLIYFASYYNVSIDYLCGRSDNSSIL